jgi:hypothetical protein
MIMSTVTTPALVKRIRSESHTASWRASVDTTDCTKAGRRAAKPAYTQFLILGS